MELEQRVQAIEQELQILKNQIQAALLEIQEHLLTNAYPTLRSEEAAPAPQQRGSAQPQRPANDDFFDEGPALNVRKVSSNADTRGRADREKASLQHAIRTTQEIDLTSMTELENWTIQKIEQMGAERARDLIQVYTEKGRFSPEICEALQHFVDLYDSANAPTQAARPVSRETQAYAPVRATSQQSAVRTGADSAAARRAAQTQTQPTARVTDQPETPSIPKPVLQQVPASSNGKGKGKNAKSKDAPAEAKGQSGLVLRLIAGVQNAGAGVRWKKDEEEENG